MTSVNFKTESSFSTLKFIKNHLRTRLSQGNSDALMLMATENEVLMNLDSNEVIRQGCGE